MLAFALGHVFQLEPLFFIGIILIACSPGGSSSNIFSMIAKGDVALSVSLTACSSIITLFTIPVIMEFATHFVDSNLDIDIHLPVGSLIMQNWIANWQLGNEAWADYRRTGYPRLMPATEDGNKSLGVVDSELGARRMPYPADEYTTNNVNVNNAVSSLLKGTDNMATRMWWDCNPAIK
jgi:hypothetical protein